MTGEEKLSTKSAFAWVAFGLIMIAALPFFRLWMALEASWLRIKAGA